MVKEIDGYTEEKQKEHRKNEIFQIYLEIVLCEFSPPAFRIKDATRSCSTSYIDVYYTKPNEHFERYTMLSRNLDRSKENEETRVMGNFIAERINISGGWNPSLTIYPLRYSLEIFCPEIYEKSKLVAEALERKIGGEIKLETKYKKEDKQEGAVIVECPVTNASSSRGLLGGLLSKLWKAENAR
jgi:hypothetical protein